MIWRQLPRWVLTGEAGRPPLGGEGGGAWVADDRVEGVGGGPTVAGLEVGTQHIASATRAGKATECVGAGRAAATGAGGAGAAAIGSGALIDVCSASEAASKGAGQRVSGTQRQRLAGRKGGGARHRKSEQGGPGTHGRAPPLQVLRSEPST
jgi:hypothetical protein